MQTAEIKAAVQTYWDRRAPQFNGAASHIRHADAWRAVLEAAFGPGGPRDAVDFGTGTGAVALIAAALGHRVRAYDGSAPMLEVARANARRAGLDVTFVHGFLDEAVVAPECADIVTLRNVLWTLERPLDAAILAWRTLRPGGRIVVSDGLWSVSEKDRSTYSADLAASLPYHRGLTETDGRALLLQAGFEVPQSWQHLFPEPPYPGDTPYFVLCALKPVKR